MDLARLDYANHRSNWDYLKRMEEAKQRMEIGAGEVARMLNEYQAKFAKANQVYSGLEDHGGLSLSQIIDETLLPLKDKNDWVACKKGDAWAEYEQTDSGLPKRACIFAGSKYLMRFRVPGKDQLHSWSRPGKPDLTDAEHDAYIKSLPKNAPSGDPYYDGRLTRLNDITSAAEDGQSIKRTGRYCHKVGLFTSCSGTEAVTACHGAGETEVCYTIPGASANPKPVTVAEVLKNKKTDPYLSGPQFIALRLKEAQCPASTLASEAGSTGNAKSANDSPGSTQLEGGTVLSGSAKP